MITYTVSICSGLGVLAVLTYWTQISWDDVLIYGMNFTWFFGSAITALTIFLAGVFFFLAISVNDSCDMTDIATANLEGVVGSSASTVLSSCFADSSLSTAFNISSDLKFEESLAGNFMALQQFDVSSEFAKVYSNLLAVDEKIQHSTRNSDFHTLLATLNETTNLVNSNRFDAATKVNCPFDFPMTLSSLYSFDLPWLIATNNGKRGDASWRSLADYELVSYDRLGQETAEEYVERVFNVGGRCTGGPDLDHPQLCLQAWSANIMPVSPTEYCTGGDGCEYPCASIVSSIKKNFTSISATVTRHENMLANLGVSSCPTNYTCPTAAFTIASGKSQTVKGLIDSLNTNVSAAASTLLALEASPGVADILEETRVFKCNQNCKFVVEKFADTKSDWCENVLGAALQTSLGLWSLSLSMTVQCWLAALLVVRLRGKSKKDFVEEEEYEEEEEGGGMGEDFDLYQ